MTRWGIVATVKAPLPEIERFAAWHLELGATRLILYLDDADAAKAARLSAHPRIVAIATGDAYWATHRRRPGKHQVRQTANATRAAAEARDLDWLAHVDVDEFLLPDGPSVADQLAALPAGALCARMRPAEALAPDAAGDALAPDAAGDALAPDKTGDGTTVLFKAFAPDPAARRAAARACFGPWGDVLAAGFLSHVAGKLFVRPAAGGWDLRIHNAVLGGVQNPGEAALPALPLGHFHAADYDRFRAALAFRLKRGSYRAELRPSLRQPGAPTTHDLLSGLLARDGEAGLRAFFAAVCTATPRLCENLAAHGLLVRRAMPLGALRARHFPA